MQMKLTLDQALALSIAYMRKGYHCGPAVLQVMLEAYGVDNDDFQWAGIPFLSGISGNQQAPCGAVSGAAVALGLRHRCPLSDKKAAKQARNLIRKQADQFVKDFNGRFGDITCRSLVQMDFSKPGEYKRFRESGIWKNKCEKYVQYAIERLYELESSAPSDSGDAD
jgi:C_GCAxxG_C_C family probable redox protein